MRRSNFPAKRALLRRTSASPFCLRNAADGDGVRTSRTGDSSGTGMGIGSFSVRLANGSGFVSDFDAVAGLRAVAGELFVSAFADGRLISCSPNCIPRPPVDLFNFSVWLFILEEVVMSFNGGLIRRKLESTLPTRTLAHALEGSAVMRAWKICFGSSSINPSSAP